MKLIANSIGFAFVFEGDKEREEFFTTIEEKKDGSGFFFPLNNKTDKAEIDKSRKILLEGLKDIDDLITISGSREHLECVMRTMEFLKDENPAYLPKADFKTAFDTIKRICHK